MAELTDLILVGLSVGLALWAVIKYFINLGRLPKGQAISCSGCNSVCHDDIIENPTLEVINKLKTK